MSLFNKMKRHIIKTKDKTKNMKKNNKFVKRWGCLEFDNARTIKFKMTTNREVSKEIHKKIERVLKELGYELLETHRLNRSGCHKKVK